MNSTVEPCVCEASLYYSTNDRDYLSKYYVYADDDDDDDDDDADMMMM